MPSGRKQSRRKIAPTRIALADKEPAFQEASSSLKEDLQTPASSPQARMSKPTMLDGSCPNRGPRQLPSDAASSCQPEVVKHGNVAIGNSAAAINSPLQGIKSWRQAVESPTTAWIRQAGSPVNSISNAHAASHPSAAQAHSHPTSDPPATELHSKPARERSSSPVSRGTSHANSNPAPLAGPSRFSPAQSHASFQGQSPVTTQHSTNVVMSGAWGAGPPRTRPGSMSSPRSGASQPVGDAERPITSDAAAVAQASCRQVYEPSGKSASPGKPLRAALQGGSGKSAGRRPMHPQAHALASTGSSQSSVTASDRHVARAPLRYEVMVIKEQDLQTASNVQAFEGAIPLCTPMKAPVRKASQQGVDFPSAEKSAASSVEAQASSTEAVVESSREEIQGRSPDCTSPGDASSPGQHAHIFACCVLEHAGNLPTSMGLSVMEALAAHPAMQEHAPKLLEQLQSRMHQLSSSSSIGAGLTPHNQRRTSLGSFPGLLGLSGLTLDAHASASQDERRRISNREHCRDDWLACLRTAASQGGLFAFISSPQTGPGSHSSLLAPHGSREAAFAEMQKGAAAVLRRLRPDNMRDFAELVTQGLLQAAATGEALLDDELAGLARRDPSRFQRLNQRLQASQGPRQQHNGMVSPSAGAASRGSARGSMAGYGAEGTTASLAAIDEFPAALRLHAMFIEAADSYRLNQHLMRCMVAKLKALTSAGGASAPSQSAMSEKLAMQCALALFISHMHFAERSQPGDTADRLPLDVMAALQGDLPAVASALAWVTRLFWFATRDEAAIVSQQMQAIKLTLASLRCQAQLRPSHAGFTTAAFIVRALLDELMPRLGMESSMLLPPTREADARSGNGGEPGGASRGGGDGIGAVQRKLPASEARNLTFGKGEEANLAAAGLCCPQLDTARQALQASLKGTSQSSSVKTSQRPSRKITPALPRRTPLAASISIPPALQAIAQGESDPLQLKLQQAFLDQYSASHHTVKLRALVEYLTDVVTANACSSALAGVQDIAAVPANAGSSHASGLRDGPVLQQALMELQARALCHLKRAVGQALPALAAPEWPVAAVAAASALVAGRAEAAAAQRLISEAPARVQQAMASLARSETISASKSAGVPPKGPAGPN
ncbi:hypothetical protein WJX84_011146 [Apatococcus fuscideae]|uniref:Codanin-1 C-terminal domain-containing protein n=1 Tax=Apatococcus fuscideae TaxID=2026836 RepID=A0AAW1SXJ6_9CHLO